MGNSCQTAPVIDNVQVKIRDREERENREKREERDREWALEEQAILDRQRREILKRETEKEIRQFLEDPLGIIKEKNAMTLKAKEDERIAKLAEEKRLMEKEADKFMETEFEWSATTGMLSLRLIDMISYVLNRNGIASPTGKYRIGFAATSKSYNTVNDTLIGVASEIFKWINNELVIQRILNTFGEKGFKISTINGFMKPNKTRGSDELSNNPYLDFMFDWSSGESVAESAVLATKSSQPSAPPSYDESV